MKKKVARQKTTISPLSPRDNNDSPKKDRGPSWQENTRMSPPGVKNPSISPWRISQGLLDHLHRDHPIEGAIADKLIEAGEWVISEGKV